jgi:hypothetical protein
MNWEFGLPEASPAFFQLQQDLSMRHYKNFYIAGDYIGLPSLDACIESAKNVATAIKSVH